jgi:clan AA aspartic protease
MGAVMQKIRLTNSFDAERARLGQIAPEARRSLEVEALVDTGATTLVLPAEIADQLGLTVMGETTATLADGSSVPIKQVSVQLEILGRAMLTLAYVLPAGTTPLIGQIPLEELDLVVEPRDHTLRLNDPSRWVIKILSAA